jgi:hypothetical protein
LADVSRGKSCRGMGFPFGERTQVVRCSKSIRKDFAETPGTGAGVFIPESCG